MFQLHMRGLTERLSWSQRQCVTEWRLRVTLYDINIYRRTLNQELALVFDDEFPLKQVCNTRGVNQTFGRPWEGLITAT